jgi:murein DD-endopeptidase MepM/ murein hydrolase activator NlpD
VYIIQSGDTLYAIALRFGITVDDLIRANTLVDPNILSAGTELVIPGLEGIQGKLITEGIPLGQNLYSLSRYYGVSQDLLNRLNRLTSPAEVYAGSNLIIPQSDSPKFLRGVQPLSKGESALEWAISQNANPWATALDNQASSPNRLIPSEGLFMTTADFVEPPNPLAPLATSLSVSPLPLVQGNTTVIRIVTSSPATISGTLNGYPLHFVQVGETEYLTIQGIHAMATPGLTEFSIAIDAGGNSLRYFSQMVLLQQGFFAQDPPLTVDPATIDKAITVPEDELVKSTTTPVTDPRYWDGIFRLPVDEPWCIKSWYGNRRSYNQSDYVYFHTGVDYGVCATLNIYTPAAGKVVYAGPLDVRGNSIIIDHGWGIYSGIWHQAEIFVTKGDLVDAGQLIGSIGATGRVTGPHLHWEVWANGVQVEPLQWLENTYP